MTRSRSAQLRALQFKGGDDLVDAVGRVEIAEGDIDGAAADRPLPRQGEGLARIERLVAEDGLDHVLDEDVADGHLAGLQEPRVLDLAGVVGGEARAWGG